MKRTYKNVYGDGRVEYVDYEIDDPDPEPTAEDKAEAYDILTGVSE